MSPITFLAPFEVSTLAISQRVAHVETTSSTTIHTLSCIFFWYFLFIRKESFTLVRRSYLWSFDCCFEVFFFWSILETSSIQRFFEIYSERRREWLYPLLHLRRKCIGGLTRTYLFLSVKDSFSLSKFESIFPRSETSSLFL